MIFICSAEHKWDTKESDGLEVGQTCGALLHGDYNKPDEIVRCSSILEVFRETCSKKHPPSYHPPKQLTHFWFNVTMQSQKGTSLICRSCGARKWVPYKVDAPAHLGMAIIARLWPTDVMK